MSEAATDLSKGKKTADDTGTVDNSVTSACDSEFFEQKIEVSYEGNFFSDALSAIRKFNANHKNTIVAGIKDNRKLFMCYGPEPSTFDDIISFVDSTGDPNHYHRVADSEGRILVPGMMRGSLVASIADLLFPGLENPEYEIRFNSMQYATEESPASSFYDFQVSRTEIDGRNHLEISANCYGSFNQKLEGLGKPFNKRGNVHVMIKGVAGRCFDSNRKSGYDLNDKIIEFYNSRGFSPEFTESVLSRMSGKDYMISLIPGEIVREGEKRDVRGGYGRQIVSFEKDLSYSGDVCVEVEFPQERRLNRFLEGKVSFLAPRTDILYKGDAVGKGKATVISTCKIE